MKVGIPVWGEIVSPVFDVATVLLVADVNRGDVLGKTLAPITGETGAQRVQSLCRARIDVLICGAVSETPASLVEASGIELIPFIRGNAEKVLRAFIYGRLPAAAHSLPGCARQRRRSGRGGFTNRAGRMNKQRR
jgi:predicted Fe-Mo cluster-binding NifX family protein